MLSVKPQQAWNINHSCANTGAAATLDKQYTSSIGRGLWAQSEPRDQHRWMHFVNNEHTLLECAVFEPYHYN